MNKNKKLKTIVITGSGTGLGRALARRFYQSGDFNLCLIGRSKNSLLQTAKPMDPKKVLCIPADIRDYRAVTAAFMNIRNRYDGIDILINNAGVFEMLPIDKTTPQVFENILKTNTFGTFCCTKETLKLMQKTKKGGSIVNILSIVTEKDLPWNSAYAASKYAIKGMMNSLRQEVAGQNIRITNISPGRIDTDMWSKKSNQKSQSPQELAEIMFSLLTQKTLYPTDITLLPIDN